MNNKISTILELMKATIIEKKSKIINSKAEIKCETCNEILQVSAESIYKQYIRGNDKYICKKCSGKKSWTKDKRNLASDMTKANWDNPGYAGKIIGKAIAREIIKKSDESAH